MPFNITILAAEQITSSYPILKIKISDKKSCLKRLNVARLIRDRGKTDFYKVF